MVVRGVETAVIAVAASKPFIISRRPKRLAMMSPMVGAVIGMSDPSSMVSLA